MRSARLRAITLASALLAAAAAYLLLWPVPIEPQAWQAPRFGGYAAPHARNDRLAAVVSLTIGAEVGPEHIEFGPDGKLYTGVLSGKILRMNPDGSGLETVADTGGRPLGLDFDAAGRLIVADALRGLLAIEPGGRIVGLAGTAGGTPIVYADAVTVASDGRIIFTDASSRLSPRDFGTFDAALLDILEHSCTGRVLELDPVSGVSRTVVRGLCFPNGVALTTDELSLIVAETGAYRIWSVPRSSQDLDVRSAAAMAPDAGSARVILANLPGFPDNVTRGADGRFWTGFTKPRSAAVDALADKPWLRSLTLRLPRALWPVPPKYGHVIAFDVTGRVLADLQDPNGLLPETSGATEHNGKLYVQSLHAQALGVIDRAAAGF
jgi:sugar lactone lactonase YvrE